MSLTRFAQRYVFVPLGGMRRERQYIAIFLSIMVIAVWHGVTAPMLVFGFYHATIMVAHRFVSQRWPAAALADQSLGLRMLKSFLVILFVSFSIPLLILDTANALSFYGQLFGQGAG